MADIRVVIADDEPLARHGLARLLAGHGDLEVVSESRNGREAVHAIRTLQPDLVFLDVQMPELDGFEVLRALAPAPLPLVVFITAFDDYAVRAFELAAIDYLVKPFTDRRFAEMLDRARHRLRQSEAAAVAHRLAALLAHTQAAPGAPAAGVSPGAGAVPGADAASGADAPADKERAPEAAAGGAGASPDDRSPPELPARAPSLIVTTGRRSVVVPIADIDWIEAQDYCVLIHHGGASHLLRESIRTLAERLAPHHFLRVHRSALVNLARVRELRRPSRGEWLLVLDGGLALPVSRRMRPTVTRHVAQRG